MHKSTPDKLQVVHLIRSLSIGGIETQLLDFCNNAHEHGISVHVICYGGGELENEFEKSPARFVKMKKIKRPYDLVDPLLIRNLKKYFRKHDIKIVHAHFADEGIHALAAARGLNGIKVIQGLAVDFRLNRKIDNLKFNFLCRKADGCVALTEVLRQQTMEFTNCIPDKIHVVHDGIDPDRILQKEPSALRSELNLPQAAVLGGMIGNFYNNVRNQLEVCRALEGAINENNNLHFVFAGGDKNRWVKSGKSYFQECVDFCREAGIGQNVHFLGLRPDVSNILAGLDFYVHSTNYDTFGIAPVEAALNGLPVIANNHPVFVETSHRGAGMELYETGGVRDLTEKIKNLSRDNALRVETGNRHRGHAMEHFHVNVHIRNMKRLYQKLLAS